MGGMSVFKMGVLAAVDEQLAESIAEPPADNLDIVR
jgi:hypothetical protein